MITQLQELRLSSAIQLCESHFVAERQPSRDLGPKYYCEKQYVRTRRGYDDRMDVHGWNIDPDGYHEGPRVRS